MVVIKTMDLNPGTMEADVFLMCDSSNEISKNMAIPGLPAGYKVAPFSKVMTKKKELAILGSDGEWDWGD